MKKRIFYLFMSFCMLLTLITVNQATVKATNTQEKIINDSVIGTGLNQFNYVGSWGSSSGYPQFYMGDEHWSNATRWAEGTPPYFTFRFEGSGIELFGNKDSMMGIYEVYIDDKLIESVDAYNASTLNQQLLFSKTDLEDGVHTLKLQLTRNKNEASTSTDGEIDFAKVYYTEKVVEKGPLDIYPVPREIKYNENQTVLLDADVNIVMHEDETSVKTEAYKNRLIEALENNAQTYTISSQPVEDKSNIFLINKGIECEECNQFIEAEGIDFEINHQQGSLVKLSDANNENTNVMIIGTDADGVYYGVVNFEQVLNQKDEQGNYYEVAISDYPNLEFRGFIEGFFGPPWTHDGRKELLNFSGDVKMNRYIYGPKDDEYHRTKWREPYPEALGKQITELVEISNKNNVEFSWAVHTTLGGDTIDYESEKDRADLLAKFESMYDLGVRSYSIFFDDVVKEELKDPIKQAELSNFVYENFILAHDDIEGLAVVPTEYAGIVPSYLEPFGANLHEDITVIWTGTSTCPDSITRQDLENMKAALGREVLIWWNYPVNDYWYDTPGRLFMGPVTGLDTSIDSTNTYGILSNPMSWESASQVALFGLADYTWNPNAYDSAMSWERSIEKLVPDEADAMKLFSKNSSHLGETASMKIRRNDDPYLVPLFTAFTEKLDAKESIIDTANALKTEFQAMIDAAARLREMDNKALLEEMKQWLDQFTYVGTAGLETMNMYIALEQNKMEDYNASREVAQEMFTLMAENKRSTQVSAMPVLNILVATQYVTPFIEKYYDKIFDAEYFKDMYITEMSVELFNTTIYKTNYKELMVDQDLSTKLWTEKNQAKDQAIQINFTKEEELHVISVFMEGEDNIKNGVLQYSEDGTEWHDLKDLSKVERIGNYNVVRVNGKGVKANHVRLLVTADAEYWMNVNEVIFTNPTFNDDALNKTIQAAEQVENLDLYTEETVALFETSLTEAKQLLKDGVVAQNQIDGAESKLKNAMEALTYLDADYTAVDKAIEKVPEDLETYTTTSKNKLVAVLDNIDRNKNITEQEMVDQYVKDIEKAISELVTKASSTTIETLKNLVESCKAMESDYSETEFADMKALLKEVETLLAKDHDEITASEADKAITALQEEKQALENAKADANVPNENDNGVASGDPTNVNYLMGMMALSGAFLIVNKKRMNGNQK